MGTELIENEQPRVGEIIELNAEQKLAETSLEVAAQAREIEIADNETYVLACELENRCKQVIKETKAHYGPRKQERRSAWQELIDQEGAVVDRLQQAIDFIFKRRSAWEREQERLRKEAEQTKQEEERKKAEEDALSVAQVLESVGEKELAAKVVSEVLIPTANVASSVPNVKGASTYKNWVWRVKDEAKIAREYLAPDDVKIGQMIDALGKQAENVVGGIECFEETERTRRKARRG